MALQDEIELGFVAADILFFFVDDKSRVSLGPMADGFEKAPKRGGVDDLDTNFLFICLGQFTEPVCEQQMIFFDILRIVVEVALIPFFPQTELVCHEFVMPSITKGNRD